MEDKTNNNTQYVKKELFSTFCLGVGAVAAAPKAGQTIRQVVDYVKDKVGENK